MVTRLLHVGLTVILLTFLIPPQLITTAQEGYLPIFEDEPCVLDFPGSYDVDCGFLVVPQQRGDPQGPTVKVAVAIVRSTNPQPKPDPVIFLIGGPGSPLLEHTAATGLGPMIEGWLQTRDVILFDQRGIGLSQPALTCPVFDELGSRGLSQEDFEAQALAELRACADTFSAQGYDLTAFNTLENADDVADLPVALGYETANFYGLSYGSAVILNVIRRHPDRVRSAILEGVVAPDVNNFPLFASSIEHALREVIAACDEDSACRAAFPDLETVTFDLIQRLSDETVHMRVENPNTHAVVEAELDDDWLITTIRDVLFYPADVGSLPAAVYLLAAEQYEALVASMQDTSNVLQESTDDIGAYYAYTCGDNVLGHPKEEIEAALAGLHPALHKYFLTAVRVTQERCAVWPTEPVAPEALKPVVSDIPVLMLSGRFDPSTPARYADHVLETLPNGYHFVFPTMGHGVGAMSNRCAARMSAEFLDTPTRAPDASCIEREPSIRFVIPGR